MQYTQEIRLDVSGECLYRYVQAKQGDQATRFIQARLYAGGAEINLPSGATAEFRCLKPDGKSVLNLATINEDGSVTAELTEQVLAVPGQVQADISIKGADGERLSTASFIIQVDAAPVGKNIVSSNEFLELLNTIDRSEELIGGYETALAQLQAIQDAAEESASEAGENANAAALSAAEAEQKMKYAQGASNAAASSASDAQKSAAEAQGYADAINPAQLNSQIAAKADNLYFDPVTNLLYLMADGEIIGDGVQVATGGGGGSGGGLSYSVTLQNLLESRILTVAEGAPVILKLRYSSVDADGMDDGPGIGSITVGGIRKATFAAKQGDNTIDVTQYLSASANTVKIRVENSEGAAKTLSYTITVVSLALTTTFDTLAAYSGSVDFAYTLTGAGTKSMHFLMDGTEIGTAEVKSNGRSQTFTIPSQAYGGHLFSAYAEMEVDGLMVRSNTVALGMIWQDETATTPAIAVTADAVSATQGESLIFPFMVYDPTSESAVVTLAILDASGSCYSTKTITVDRTPQVWTTQDYPAGNVTFRISCGSVSKTISGTIAAFLFPLEPVSDGLALEFSAAGRSNGEDHPANWSYGNIEAAFSGFGWADADGWLHDADGVSILRFLPGDAMTIPFTPFATDARDTGYTIEVELSTRDVRDYETVVVSCLSGGRGFQIASQSTKLQSEQTSVSMVFKEDTKVRVSYVVEQRNQNRLVYLYINGIMCGVNQYPTTDDFSQPVPVGLTIGAESCGLDLYHIRCYSKPLTRHEQLDNYICDQPTLQQRKDAYQRNDILDDSEEISVEKLPPDLPYMIIACPQLPQYKGDKKSGATVTFVDPADSGRSFTAENVQLDVQGTSSAGYPVKNEKIKAKSGFTVNGQQQDGYQLSASSIPVSTFCLKADYASSENANNVMLVNIYEQNCPYKTPPQQEDSRVRQGIEGRPMVLFWQNTETGKVSFVGKFNFNNDKSTPEVFGFTADYPNAESWEIRNNTSERVLFKRSDYGEGWLQDFEARHPDGSTDFTRLKRLTDWIVSTNRDAVTTLEDKAARLAKFKAEFTEYFVKDAMLYYYLFTEVFLMVDSRAKNMFLTTYDGTHWLCIPYDFDTALGINNEGTLSYTYSLEDTDTVGGALVFNGQNSTLWCNVRDAFRDELSAMYKELRSKPSFSYAAVKQAFSAHQSVWPEALWNEDAFTKWLQPFLLRGENYIAMLQGDKGSQRDWWLFNGFRYRDSKYQTGDATSQFITLRCYAMGDITVTPYADIWPAIKYGSYIVHQRGYRNVPCTLVNPLDTMNDTEVYIYSADRIASIGNLSGLQVGMADFSMAVKLQQLILGSNADGYTNQNLTSLYVGNNELLTLLNIENCAALTQAVDLSGCSSLETVQAKGSAIAGIVLPSGGHLKTLALPATVSNFTVQNQRGLQSVTLEGYGSLTTLRVENTLNVPLEEIINGAKNLNRVRLIGVEWTAASEETLQTSVTKLKACIGMDASGNNTATAVVTGRVYAPSVSAALLTEINEAFPQLVVVADGVPQYIVRYLDWDNTVLYRAVVSEGANAVNAVTAGYITAPTKAGTEDTGYAFKDFGALPTDIHSNVTVIAQYVTTYRVRFMNGDAVYNTQWIESGKSATRPSGTPTKASTAQYTYTFSNWSGSYTNVTAPVDITATYTATIRKYTVYFYNGSTLLQTVQNVPYGSSASYTGDTPVSPDGSAEDYPFEGWSPSPTNIKGNTSCYAQYGSPLEVAEITDSWDEILAAVADGTYAAKYKVGNYKPLDLGSEGIVSMQIAAKNKDALADGSGTAPITWISKELLNTSHRMNPSLVSKQPAVVFNPSASYLWAAVADTANKFESTNAGKGSTSSVGCWKVKSPTAGQLTINYTQSGESSYDYLTLRINGKEVFNGKTRGQDYSGTYTVDLSPNVEIMVAAIFTKDSSGDKGSDKGTVEFAATDLEVSIPTNVVTIIEEIPATEGTGSIGGWEKSEMRTYFKNTVKPLIPANVQGAIKNVTKTQPAYNGAQASFTQTTTDDVWIPSYSECFGTGAMYKALFPDNASRVKKKVGAASASWWWLRSAYGHNAFTGVTSVGSYANYCAHSSGAVALGFCT